MRLADVRLIEEGTALVASLTGELDLSNAGNIGAAVAEAVPNSAHVLILDLSQVEYLDSAGIHLIYELRERVRARGQSLRLVIPGDSPVNDALRLAGVTGFVDVAETVSAALASG